MVSHPGSDQTKKICLVATVSPQKVQIRLNSQKEGFCESVWAEGSGPSRSICPSFQLPFRAVTAEWTTVMKHVVPDPTPTSPFSFHWSPSAKWGSSLSSPPSLCYTTPSLLSPPHLIPLSFSNSHKNTPSWLDSLPPASVLFCLLQYVCFVLFSTKNNEFFGSICISVTKRETKVFSSVYTWDIQGFFFLLDLLMRTQPATCQGSGVEKSSSESQKLLSSESSQHRFPGEHHLCSSLSHLNPTLTLTCCQFSFPLFHIQIFLSVQTLFSFSTVLLMEA